MPSVTVPRWRPFSPYLNLGNHDHASRAIVSQRVLLEWVWNDASLNRTAERRVLNYDCNSARTCVSLWAPSLTRRITPLPTCIKLGVAITPNARASSRLGALLSALETSSGLAACDDDAATDTRCLAGVAIIEDLAKFNLTYSIDPTQFAGSEFTLRLTTAVPEPETYMIDAGWFGIDRCRGTSQETSRSVS